jgi:hypothetical protein
MITFSSETVVWNVASSSRICVATEWDSGLRTISYDVSNSKHSACGFEPTNPRIQHRPESSVTTPISGLHCSPITWFPFPSPSPCYPTIFLIPGTFSRPILSDIDRFNQSKGDFKACLRDTQYNYVILALQVF